MVAVFAAFIRFIVVAVFAAFIEVEPLSSGPSIFRFVVDVVFIEIVIWGASPGFNLISLLSVKLISLVSVTRGVRGLGQGQPRSSSAVGGPTMTKVSGAATPAEGSMARSTDNPTADSSGLSV